MNKNIFKSTLAIVLMSFVFSGCFDKKDDESIKIGVVLGLTGKYSNLGIYEKNGIILAFDKIDYKINGKKIDLIFKDDKQDANADRKAINELIKDNVKIIIANATSSMSKVSLDILSKHDDLFQFSPTASSSQFSNKDDNFFRVQTANSSKHFGNLVKLLKENNAQHIYLIGDKNNKTYLYDYLHLFDENNDMKFEAIIDSNLPYKEILSKVKNADFIVQVQNSTDAASLIQYLRIHKNTTPIISSGWAKNKEFIENCGNWANGVYFISSDYINYEDKGYKLFAKEFNKTYKHLPNRFNIQGYQTAIIIIDALQNGNKSTDDIKKYILETETFRIAGDTISFNKYGDIKTPYYIFEVKENKFVKIR